MKHIEDFLNYLTLEKGYSQNTIEAYGRDLKYFLNFLKKDWKDVKK